MNNGKFTFDESHVIEMDFGGKSVSVDLYEARMAITRLQTEHGGPGQEAMEGIRLWLKERYEIEVSLGTAYLFNNAILEETDRRDEERKKKYGTSPAAATTSELTPANGGA